MKHLRSKWMEVVLPCAKQCCYGHVMSSFDIRKVRKDTVSEESQQKGKRA